MDGLKIVVYILCFGWLSSNLTVTVNGVTHVRYSNHLRFVIAISSLAYLLTW